MTAGRLKRISAQKNCNLKFRKLVLKIGSRYSNFCPKTRKGF